MKNKKKEQLSEQEDLLWNELLRSLVFRDTNVVKIMMMMTIMGTTNHRFLSEQRASD